MSQIHASDNQEIIVESISLSQVISYIRSETKSVLVKKSVSYDIKTVTSCIKLSYVTETISKGNLIYVQSNSGTQVASYTHIESYYVQVISYPVVITTLSEIQVVFYTLRERQKSRGLSPEGMIGLAVGAAMVFFLIVGIFKFIYKHKQKEDNFTSGSESSIETMDKYVMSKRSTGSRTHELKIEMDDSCDEFEAEPKMKTIDKEILSKSVDDHIMGKFERFQKFGDNKVVFLDHKDTYITPKEEKYKP